jgi:hypothetical protein
MFVPNPLGKEKLLADPDVRAGLMRQTREVARLATALAEAVGGPWMRRAGQETVQAVETDNGVFLVNTDHAGHLIEFGSARTPPHAPLRRAAAAAGLRYEGEVR